MKSGSSGNRVPPVEHRFKKGQSGNPTGRPKGSKNKREKRPHFFEQRVPVMHRGKRRTVTRAQYLLDYARKIAIGKRDSEITDWLLSYKETLDRADEKSKHDRDGPIQVGDIWYRDGPVTCFDDALRHLDIVVVMRRFQHAARMRLNPWIVSAALARMGDEALSREEQERVLHATRGAWQVDWPDWWEPDLRGKKRKAPHKIE